MGIKVPSTVVLYDSYEETKDNMPNLVFNDINWDEEYTHIKADDLIIELLKSLGYNEGAQIIDDMPKWYS